MTLHVLVELLYASDLHELKINMSHLDIAGMTTIPGGPTNTSCAEFPREID